MTPRMIQSLARKRKERVERRDNKLSRKTIGDKREATRKAKRANKQQVLMMRRLQQRPIKTTPKRKKKKKMLQLASLCR